MFRFRRPVTSTRTGKTYRVGAPVPGFFTNLDEMVRVGDVEEVGELDLPEIEPDGDPTSEIDPGVWEAEPVDFSGEELRPEKHALTPEEKKAKAAAKQREYRAKKAGK